MSVRRWTGSGWGWDGDVRRRLPNDGQFPPPHTIWMRVDHMAMLLASHRPSGEALLGKRQARQWLKELGARRRANQGAQR